MAQDPPTGPAGSAARTGAASFTQHLPCPWAPLPPPALCSSGCQVPPPLGLTAHPPLPHLNLTYGDNCTRPTARAPKTPSLVCSSHQHHFSKPPHTPLPVLLSPGTQEVNSQDCWGGAAKLQAVAAGSLPGGGGEGEAGQAWLLPLQSGPWANNATNKTKPQPLPAGRAQCSRLDASPSITAVPPAPPQGGSLLQALALGVPSAQGVTSWLMVSLGPFGSWSKASFHPHH